MIAETATEETVNLITGKKEDIPQYPRLHQPLELIIAEGFDPVVIIGSGKEQSNTMPMIKLGTEKHRIVGLTKLGTE